MTDPRIKREALYESETYDYWFRQHYKLSPKDPRYLEMEPWELRKEFHAYVAWQRRCNGQDSTAEVHEFATNEEAYEAEVASWGNDSVGGWSTPMSEKEILDG